ncbi:hypothetical protein OO014_05580 [Intrasporangium calvum]|uniref:Helix-turn-helix transcriptional regulator n=1 Tax=Intrasporangium calvum TaxID=53358 RepID=A0ABT5GFQ9_9MICO|nr:hypothetical protein [Intrasporangium calvum]MDC5696720.1 hypothetical protein [Intrasporangium calvum]
MMLVDCQTCPVRDVHCADCMVTALTAIPVGAPGAEPDRSLGLPLDRAERRAVSVLIAAGLVTPETANAARALPDGESTPLRLGRAAV